MAKNRSYRRKDTTSIIAVISTIGCIYFYFTGGNCDYKYVTAQSKKDSRIVQAPNLQTKDEPNSDAILRPYKNEIPEEAVISPRKELTTLPQPMHNGENVLLGTTVQAKREIKKPMDMKNGQEYQLEQKLNSDWPRVNIHDCKKVGFMNKGINSPSNIGNKLFPRTGLVSFPGSGNTWARHLLQQATGLYTGSVYEDKSLLAGGFLGEAEDCMNNSTVAIKAHYPPYNVEQSHCKFDRVILVIRDPFRALLAEFNWRATGVHTGIADPRLYRTKIWREHVINRSRLWASTTNIWLQRFVGIKDLFDDSEDPFTAPGTRSKTLLLISFERLKQNALGEMQRVMEFLGLPAFRRQCIQEDSTGKFHRKSTSKSASEIACRYQRFELREVVANQIGDLKKAAQKMGLGDISGAFEGIEKVETENCE